MTRRPLSRTLTAVLAWSLQFLIGVIGLISLFDESMSWSLAWVIAGTLYALGTVIVLAVLARRPAATAPRNTAPSWFSRFRGVMTVVFTVVPVAIGVSSALSVIVFGREGDGVGILIKILGVWAMLLAWGFLHWGFAQLYAFRAERSRPVQILAFPETEHPSLVDYVYFSFTIGATFAASDVSVLTTRTRWFVTVHSVVSFFLNALVIVLAFNTIISAGG